MSLVSSRRLFFWVFLGGIIIAAAYQMTSLSAVLNLFYNSDPELILLAVLAQVVTYLCTAKIYQMMIHVVEPKHTISLKKLWRYSVVIMSLNQAVPSGGVSGNAFLVHKLMHRGVAVISSVSIVLSELVSYYAAAIMVLVGVAGTYTAVNYADLPAAFALTIVAGVLFYAGLAIAATIFGTRRPLKFLVEKIKSSSFVSKLFSEEELSLIRSEDTSKVSNPVRILWNSPAVTLQLLPLHMSILLLDALTIFILFYSFNTPVSFIAVLVGFLLTIVISAFPTSPGALIVYEGSMTFFYTALGIPLSAALTITLMYRALSFWIPIPVGLYFYNKEHDEHRADKIKVEGN